MRSFNDFMGRKDRENKSHLHLLHQILTKAGFQVENNLDDKEPYLYVKKPVSINPILEELSFGGVRIYTRGKNTICYRPQNKEKTQPFGSAYELNIEGMFKDLIKESTKGTIGFKIIFQIIKELKEFFIQSAEAEKTNTGGGEAQMGVVVGANGSDYSNKVYDIKK